ncbi:MAG: NAD(+) synthase [Cyclobacteriaceae bacterium]|nr:NAD(+) synthase [Cyclobacteriaceae bacterium]UYN88111.1 MAG: NAD(+) synthase [Cyclobacteriaceae bacterium]
MSIRVAGATLNQTPFDWKNNTGNILVAIQEAQKKGAKILCLPELCITGYGCEDTFLSEWLSAKAFEELLTIKEHCTDITVNIGLPIRIEGITYNGSCVIGNKKILGITLKQNLPKDGVHYEPRWFTPWPSGKVVTLYRNNEIIPAGDLVYETEGIRFGIEICEDGWSKERRPGYQFKERGIDLILNPSASHFALGKSLNREQEVTLEGSQLFDCVYIFCNLLGNEAGRMIYDGDILIAQKGKLLAQNKRLSFKPVNIITCLVDFEDTSKTEQFPLMDVKERNEELTKAVALALFDYLRKSKSKGFVLSLSGGADSATCAALVAEMVRRGSGELGWERFCSLTGLDYLTDQKQAVGALLTCAYQSTNNSSSDTFEAARELAISIGAKFYNWSIQPEVDSYTAKIEDALNRSLDWATDDIALQNIQARARSPIIWMLANITNSILLTTSNRSEGDVGYATMDGDTSGSLAPISGISKPTILEWLRWAETELGYTGLQLINKLKPTAELRPLENHQTDEEDLMPYTVLAEIEMHAIRDRKSPAEVYRAMRDGFNDQYLLKGHIKKFFRLWTANQWKRERFAPSFHLDELNVDPRTWCRFPILSSGFKSELEALDNL